MTDDRLCAVKISSRYEFELAYESKQQLRELLATIYHRPQQVKLIQ